MEIEEILSRLDKVKRYNQRTNAWTARCPAHDDSSPSLGVKLLDDGKILLNCLAGCGIEAIKDALGVSWADLMGDAPQGFHSDHKHSNRIPASDMLRGMAYDAMRVSLIASRISSGHPLADDEKAALMEIAQSFSIAVDYITRRKS